MTSTIHTSLHWFWAAFFAGFGVFLALRPRWYTYVSCRGLRVKTPEEAARVEAAVERRRQAERLSSTPGYVASAGAFSVALVATFTSIQASLLYGIFCMFLALTTAVTYLQLRNSAPKRVAVLAARKSESVIPLWAFGLASLSALGVLAFVSDRALHTAAIVVCISSFITIATAWRLTQLPAMLQGVDLPVETLLDERLRLMRSTSGLIFAVVQPFVLCSQGLAGAGTPQIAAYWLSVVAWIGTSVWMIFQQFRMVKLLNA